MKYVISNECPIFTVGVRHLVYGTRQYVTRKGKYTECLAHAIQFDTWQAAKKFADSFDTDDIELVLDIIIYGI